MSFKLIQYHIQQRIAYLTLNRPEKRNALNAGMVEELKTAFRKAETDSLVKVIVLKASGTVFSAGADLEYLRELQQNSHEENLADSHRLKALFLQIYTCPKMVIAQVQGHAIAGGCGLVTACDLAFSVPEALFGYTENRIGFVPALVAPLLLQKTGGGKARQLLLTGELISAEKAQDYGMINFIEEGGRLGEAVEAFARKMVAETSGSSVGLTKKLLAGLRGMPLEQGMDFAAGLNADARQGDDFRKGLQAFLDKEKPRW